MTFERYINKPNSDAELVVNFALRKDLSKQATQTYLKYVIKSYPVWKTASELVNAVFWNDESKISSLADELYRNCCEFNK
jgi:hypothetical protein